MLPLVRAQLTAASTSPSAIASMGLILFRSTQVNRNKVSLVMINLG